MKIIQSPRQAKKERASTVAEGSEPKESGYAREGVIKKSADATGLKLDAWKTRPKKKRNRSSQERAKLLNRDCFQQTSSVQEEAFEFDTSNLEAMPREGVVEGIPEGKKRRRSELDAEKVGEPLTLGLDPDNKEFNEIFARGLRLLAMREHSVKEISKKLFDKTEDSDGAEVSAMIYAVIDDLVEKKYLSDERFAEVYVRSRMNRGFGPIKIKAELRNKGVSNNLIQDYLVESAGVWFDNAKLQYQKKYAAAPIIDYNDWTKRARFMQSRGFSMEQIQVTVPRIEFD